MEVDSFLIAPFLGQHDWETIMYTNILPPIFRKPPGRPKKVRKKQHGEPMNSTKLSKKGYIMTCSKCLKEGHNVRSCKGLMHPRSKLINKKKNVILLL